MKINYCNDTVSNFPKSTEPIMFLIFRNQQPVCCSLRSPPHPSSFLSTVSHAQRVHFLLCLELHDSLVRLFTSFHIPSETLSSRHQLPLNQIYSQSKKINQQTMLSSDSEHAKLIERLCRNWVDGLVRNEMYRHCYCRNTPTRIYQPDISFHNTSAFDFGIKLFQLELVLT